jgi:hypothetical protein
VELSWDAVNCLEPEVTGYNIWHTNISGECYVNIGTIEPMDYPFYIDEDPLQGCWNYYTVTALYDGFDGEMSNEATEYVADSLYTISYDDGSCEEGFNVGVAQYMAVKFVSPTPADIFLNNIRLYIENLDTGQFVFRIFEEDNGIPGNRVAQFNITPDLLHAGWNTIEIPQEQIPMFHGGNFFISIFEMAHLSAIGKDTDSFGNSWITTGSNHIWEEVTDGNIMIRAYIFYWDNDAEPVELTPASVSINAYPNPFNPETTISFSTTYDAGITELSIYNVKGQRIREWKIENVKCKINEVIWDGRDGHSGQYVSSGVYLIRLSSGDQNVTKKVMLIK